MNPKLYKLLIELDSQDFTATDYFNWSETEKKQLTSRRIHFFIPLIQNNRGEVMYSISRVLEEAIKNEDYEQADIFSRCLTSLEKMSL